jgi:23S rRNA (cytosine1962-C5)-methyltransferase
VAAFPAVAGRVSLRKHARRHPFVFKHLVGDAPRMTPGSLVVVDDPLGEIFGVGIWNPLSDVAIRMLALDTDRFTEADLAALVNRARALRQPLIDSGTTDALRLIHAEGDGLSGLIADKIGPVLVLELFSRGWVPLLDHLLPLLAAAAGTEHHIVRFNHRAAPLEGLDFTERRSEGCPREVRITENGVRFHASLDGAHKTGFFCDQRDNRARLRASAADRTVLDVCSFSGGFGISAKLGGASDVTCIDLDEGAVALTKRNANLNQVRLSAAQSDAFNYLRQMQLDGRRFGVVILDPPKFVPTRRDEEEGLKRYADLNKLAFPLVEPGGLLVTCSCSGLVSRSAFMDIISMAAANKKRRAQLEAVTAAGIDHPVMLECPESGYLKVAWVRVW